MKSSDYFSKVYGPKHKSKKMSPEEEKRMRAIKSAQTKSEIENMLDWLYLSAKRAFNCIPESELKSFVPDEISFRFFHNDSRDYIFVQLIKYTGDENQFGTRNRKTIEHKISFQRKFSSVPEYYRKKWDNPIIILRNGYFETEYINTIKGKLCSAGITKTENCGKYKAVFTYEIGYSDRFEKFTRKL